MKIMKATNIKEWDSYIQKHSPQSYFQAWGWGEIEKKSGQKVWRVKLATSRPHIIYALSQVVKVNARRGTFLHVRHGPVLAVWDNNLFGKWLDWLVDLAKKEQAWFIRISPMIRTDTQSIPGFFKFNSAPIHNMDAERVNVLDITKSEELLLSQMRKTTRNLIRRGKKDGVIVTQSDDIDSFLRLYKNTALRHHFIPHRQISYEYEQFKTYGHAMILNGYYKNKLIASAMIVLYGHQAIYRHGASIRSKIPVAYLIQWQAILWAKSRKIPIYNFWGIADSPRRSHPWWGLTQFKLGFGGEVRHFLHASDLALTPLYYITYAIETVRRVRRRY